MAQVNLQINGRDYLVACQDGEEEHLSLLAQYINQQVEDLVQSVGQVGEARLLLMASLMVADELSEATQELEALRAGGDGTPAIGQIDLAKLTERIEDVAARLESA